jgi:hypothetical protein
LAARSAPARHPGREASSGFSLSSWCPLRVVRAADFCGPFALIIVRCSTQCSSQFAMICY